jgi:hypothetical protein
MWGNILRSALLCGVLASGIPAGTADGIDPYTPVTPREPSLAGSDVSGACERGEPVIVYSLVVTDGSSSAAAAGDPPTAATLTMTDGASTVDVPLGTVRAGRLEGSRPWPDAEWTRSGAESVVSVGALRLAVPLDYPSAAMGCSSQAAGATVLAGTGAEVPILVAGIGGAVLVAGGIVYGVGRRRSRRAAVVGR